MVRLIGEGGYASVTAERLAAEADVELHVFADLFGDLDRCIDCVWDQMTRDLISRMWSAYANEDRWRDGLRATAYLVLRYFTEDEPRSRFFMIEVLAAGELAVARRDRLFQLAVDLVDLGRTELEDPGLATRAQAEATVGAIYERILEGVRGQELEGAGGIAAVRQLMYIAVRPYFGHEVAREELAIPPPPDLGQARPEGADRRAHEASG